MRAKWVGSIGVMITVVGCGLPDSGPVPSEDVSVVDGDQDEIGLDSTEIKPFEINVPDEVLSDLSNRLVRTRFPDEVGVNWEYGTDLAYLKELVAYWRDDFDWREQERVLNSFDHYKTRIDGLDIHFVHQRSPHDDALPIIITHGWPGSIVEFTKIIGPLTNPTEHGGDPGDAFHVIAPSIPGYGFSDIPTESGMGPEQVADINAELMARLGYERYGAQGGDWGSVISSWLAFKHVDRLVGLHLNFLIAGPPPGLDDPTAGVPQVELLRMQERQENFAEETGYQQIQGTKPQTLGYGLNDSPAGLAAWIVEKFRSWCDCDGHPENIFTRDELLTNITVYWVTNTITSSARMYYESRHGSSAVPINKIEVPTAGAIFPHEVYYSPRKWVEAQYNLVRWTEMPQGGHFAAFEQPELLVADLQEFFRDFR